MRGRAGSVPGILVFPTEANRDLGNRVSGLEISPYEHLIPVTLPG